MFVAGNTGGHDGEGTPPSGRSWREQKEAVREGRVGLIVGLSAPNIWAKKL